MRLKSLAGWNYTRELEGLLFFAQLADEMLFDYTLDSYKVPALNTRLMCSEALNIALEVKKGTLSLAVLNPIIEELCHNLQTDINAKLLLGTKHDLYCDALDTKKTNLHELITIVTSLLRTFSDKAYLKSIQSTLVESVKNGNEKKLITSITKTLMTELINLGYSQGYIYYCVQRYFFNDGKGNKVTNANDIKIFLDQFDFKEHEYEVVCKGNSLFEHLKEVCSKANIEQFESLSPVTKYSGEVKFLSDMPYEHGVFLKYKVKSVDPQGARKSTERVLEVIADVFGYYHHKTRPLWSKTVMVRRLQDSFIQILDEPAKAIHKRGDVVPEQAAKLTNLTMQELPEVLNKLSFYRYARAIDYHGLALEATAIENQLLDLWATLETLFPAEGDDSKTRIMHINKQVIPFLRRKYINKLIEDLAYDIKNWNGHEYDRVLSSIAEGQNEIEKVAALITIKHNESLCDGMLKLMGDFPLLKNRMFTLHESLGSVHAVLHTIEKHTARISWHFMRIYRTRNKIIHAGQAPSYASLLVEHLHSYLDLILEQIRELALSTKKVTTIEEAVLEVRLSIQNHDRLLYKYKDVQYDAKNFVEILFGDQL